MSSPGGPQSISKSPYPLLMMVSCSKYMCTCIYFRFQCIESQHVRYMSCLGSSVGRALCLEYRVSWVRVPPVFSRKSDCLGCAVLLCLVCLFNLACFFLPSHLSFKNMYMYYIHVHVVSY